MLRRFLSLKEMDESTSLYHYTKCQSAQAILNGHSFYATNTQFLNDVNEMQYILSVVDEIIMEMDKPMWSGILKHLIMENIEEFHKYEYYLISFSTKPEYASEKEYRFVFRDPEKTVHFREQNGFLLPYIVLNCPVDERLPVRSVTVAPKNHTDLARRGMEYYLRSLGYEVPVKLSSLKLRY